MKSDSALYNAWHHRIAVFIACATLIVIIAGALVTSEDAGLSVPDWPTSYGHLIRFPPWVGGIVYEHSHRMIAWLTGFCTIVIAFWTWFVDRRRWMKALALGALGTIITQGILGGMTVLHFLPPAISSAHATVAQTFFCIAVAIAVFTGRRWVEELPQPVADHGHPKLFVLCLYSIFILYVQLVLGAMFRHHGMPWWPHVVNALSVALILTWTAVRALLQFPRIDAIRRPAVPWVRRLPHACGMDSGRRTTRVFDGVLDRRARGSRRATTGDICRSYLASLAICASASGATST